VIAVVVRIDLATLGKRCLDDVPPGRGDEYGFIDPDDTAAGGAGRRPAREAYLGGLAFHVPTIAQFSSGAKREKSGS